MTIALISDAWSPQVNGVVRTLQATVSEIRARGLRIETITPDRFRTVPCPSYPEIRLAIGCGRELANRLSAIDATALHIATEGPLGWAARRWCIDTGMPFSSSFHTRFPDYVATRTGLPAAWFWPVIRRFHAPATRIMVATDTLARELAAQRLPQTHQWSRGVDPALFASAASRSGLPPELANLARPIQLYVGRVAPEKNVAAFLDAAGGGSKVVVGDGPDLAALKQRYPAVRFLGARHGESLGAAYAAADVLVFPSRTDTFGLVMIEALAAGTPVAAFPVPGPLDVIGLTGTRTDSGHRGRIGALDEDLSRAIQLALAGCPAACMATAKLYSWRACTDQFLAGLCMARGDRLLAAA